MVGDDDRKPPLHLSLRRVARVELGIQAAVALEGSSRERPYRLADLLEDWPAPRKFLGHVLGRLSQCGVVASSRGHRGGYWLCRPLDRISIVEIIDALGPEEWMPESADAPHGAGLEALWTTIDASLREVLEGVSVADVAATMAGSKRPEATSA
jgi:Rrf2 family protein